MTGSRPQTRASTKLGMIHKVAFDQRVLPKYASPALADGYIRAHLAHGGHTDTFFSEDAVRVIHSHARGMPCAIKRLATTTLPVACAESKAITDEKSARTANAENPLCVCRR